MGEKCCNTPPSCSTEKKDESCSTTKGSCDTKSDCGPKAGGCGPSKGGCCPSTIFKGALVGGMLIFFWTAFSWHVLGWHKAGDMNFATANAAKMAIYTYFLLCLFGGALLTKLLKKRSPNCCPVGYAAKVGLLVGAFSYLPNVIWYHLPLNTASIGILDYIIAFALAGWGISQILPTADAAGCGAGCACGGKCPCCAGGGCSGKCGGKCPCPCCKGGSCETKAGSCGTKSGGCEG